MNMRAQTYTKGNTVEKHINTAYDVVKSVANELIAIKKVGTDAVLADIALIGDDIENGKIDAAIAAAISTALDLIATNADVVTTTADALATTADALESQHWANHPEDVLVPEGDLVDDYSAYHWMRKAQVIATGALIYQGDWDASGSVYPSAPELGHFYKISVAGTIAPYTLAVGDSIIYNGVDWDKIDNTEQVTSVAGYVGAVTIAQILVALKTVDGSGSGLDADLLGGVTSAAYALLASPTFTGSPTAPTPTEGDDSTKIATTAFVKTAAASVTASTLEIANVATRNWTDIAAGVPESANTWRDVVWAPSLGIFCGISYSGTNRVMTSPDGITWTVRTAANAYLWDSVTWSESLTLFVAVAWSGVGNRVMTSPDGITWTARTSAADNEWRAVMWVEDLSLFVAVASTGTANRAMTSPDGITWTIRTTPSGPYQDITYSPTLGRLCAIGSSSGSVMTSSDGITWATQTAPNLGFQSVAWGNGVFVAGGGVGTNRIMYSPTGLSGTWIEVTNPVTDTWYGTIWAAELELFVMVGWTQIITSRDGITWQHMASSVGGNDIAFSPERSLFVTLGENRQHRSL